MLNYSIIMKLFIVFVTLFLIYGVNAQLPVGPNCDLIHNKSYCIPSCICAWATNRTDRSVCIYYHIEKEYYSAANYTIEYEPDWTCSKWLTITFDVVCVIGFSIVIVLLCGCVIKKIFCKKKDQYENL